MSLREKQSVFALLIAQLIVWIYDFHEGWEVTLAEGSVNSRRREFFHMRGSLHRKRLAQDLNIFIDGKWISDGSHPAWLEIGERWEKMHSLARWGGHFRHKDSNHFSLHHDGKS